MDDEAEGPNAYEAAPEAMLSLQQARRWIRGEWVPPGRDPRLYFANVPAEEFAAIESADERGKRRRDIIHQLEGKKPKRSGDGR